ncbi:AraC family transcriptional regulator [Streptomyces sp. NBC_00503]|uniref:AraC family transcriptional regulator n=1 Tax=Streptomyces sp. NBC_00503 TaxID=2903659 RepID=UPI002E822F76|nr:AraC family transcriptional regulator [Streptomyces sp. NBC_00503]WUD85496.1 AraC family transcriptional regulator [Streptomyces sp. NBC_00503]
MDALTALLEGPKARSAFLIKSVFSPPWAVRIEDRAPLSVMTMVHGSAWLLPDGGEPVHVAPGQAALVRGPDAYTLCDAKDTPAQIRVGPDQRCSRIEDGEDVCDSMTLGVRTWGEVAGSAVLLSGTYQDPGEIGSRLLTALPPVLVGPVDPTLVGLLSGEMSRTEPAQEVVLDRLLDLLLIGVVRGWLAERGGAENDPVTGPALRLLHENPAYGWTVEALARKVGVSRAALARRFTELVGEPPMAYLTGWRLAMAADLLRDPSTTLASAAHQVGYSSAFALSTAFKRVRGVSPREYRTGTTASGAVASAATTESSRAGGR